MIVVLQCGCQPFYPTPIPVVGDVVCCPTHGPTTRVEGINWGFKCQDCRYGRMELGDAPLTAESKASAHAIKKAHRVRVWRKVGTKEDRDFYVPANPHAQLSLVGSEPTF